MKSEFKKNNLGTAETIFTKTLKKMVNGNILIYVIKWELSMCELWRENWMSLLKKQKKKMDDCCK